MARLPTPGGDNNTWGTILNDFLEVSHHSDGTLRVEVTDASKLQGTAVSSTAPTDSQVLTYNNSTGEWEAQTLPSGVGLSSSPPTTSAVGDSASTGTGSTAARTDHTHGREGFGTPGASAFGDSAAGGSATTVARSDHRHSRESGIIVAKAGTDTGTRPKVNFIEGSNVTITTADNVGSNRVDVTVASSSPSTALQDAYDNSGTPATITTSSATKDIVVKSGVGFNSATAFSVQDAASARVLDVDTTNSRVGIGTASPAWKLDINGIVNIDSASTYRVGGTAVLSALTNHTVLWSRNSSGGLRVYNAAGDTPLVQVNDGGNVGIGTTSPNSGLHVSSSIAVKRTAVADANYTILSTDYLIVYTSLTTGRTATLPTAASITGREYVIKDEAGSAGTNNITIATTGGQTLDGAATKVINTNYGVVKVYSNGANWFTHL